MGSKVQRQAMKTHLVMGMTVLVLKTIMQAKTESSLVNTDTGEDVVWGRTRVSQFLKHFHKMRQLRSVIREVFNQMKGKEVNGEGVVVDIRMGLRPALNSRKSRRYEVISPKYTREVTWFNRIN